MSGENSSDNAEERDDVAKAAAFLDIDGDTTPTADDDKATQAAAAFLETDSTSDSSEEDIATEAVAAFLKPDSDEDSDSGTPTLSDVETEADPADADDAHEDILDEDDRTSIQLNTPPDDGIERRWYAIHAHSGQEATYVGEESHIDLGGYAQHSQTVDELH